MSSPTETTTPETLDERLDALTAEVVASFDGAADERYRVVMQALVRHLHGFAREVGLREPEWEAAIDFLTRAGHMSDAKRQEVILLSDVLGLSMATIGLNAPEEPGATEPTVFGPFFVREAPEIPFGGDIAMGAPGEPCWVSGQVTALDGRPVPHADLEVWEADEDGFYDVQYPDGRTTGRAHTATDAEGRYGFWSVRPAAYPIPDDGPVGELLAAAGRGPMRPAHVHFMVASPGFQRLVTHVFVAGDEHLADDAVFGVKASLVRDVVEHPPGDGPAGRTLEDRWWSLGFDIVLAPAPAPAPAPQGA